MSETQTIANLLAKSLKDGTLKEWEFVCINSNVSFAIAKTPQRLRIDYESRVIMREKGVRQLQSLVDALHHTKMTFLSNNLHCDVRFGLIVRDEKEKEFLSLFMSHYRYALVYNNRLYSVEGGLPLWFEHLARTMTKLT